MLIDGHEGGEKPKDYERTTVGQLHRIQEQIKYSLKGRKERARQTESLKNSQGTRLEDVLGGNEEEIEKTKQFLAQMRELDMPGAKVLPISVPEAGRGKGIKQVLGRFILRREGEVEQQTTRGYYIGATECISPNDRDEQGPYLSRSGYGPGVYVCEDGTFRSDFNEMLVPSARPFALEGETSLFTDIGITGGFMPGIKLGETDTMSGKFYPMPLEQVFGRIAAENIPI